MRLLLHGGSVLGGLHLGFVTGRIARPVKSRHFKFQQLLGHPLSPEHVDIVAVGKALLILTLGSQSSSSNRLGHGAAPNAGRALPAQANVSLRLARPEGSGRGAPHLQAARRLGQHRPVLQSVSHGPAARRAIRSSVSPVDSGDSDGMARLPAP